MQTISTPPAVLAGELSHRISSCHTEWDKLPGKGRIKYCPECDLQIYDFAGMNLEEIRALIYQREGTTTYRLYRRADGRFLTADCKNRLPSNLKTPLISAACLAVIALGFSML